MLRKMCFIALLTCGIVISLAMTRPLTQQDYLAEKLKLETDQLIQTKKELAKTQHLLLIQKKIDCVVNYYKKAGTFDKWKLSRESISDWFLYCDKWKFIAGEDNKQDMTDVMIGIIHNESNGNTTIAFKEKNGTYSYGITQLNDCVVEIIEKELNELYPELKQKNIKTDMEKNIAGRYLWIKHRKEKGHSWALMNNGWTLYWFLSQVRL